MGGGKLEPQMIHESALFTILPKNLQIILCLKQIYEIAVFIDALSLLV